MGMIQYTFPTLNYLLTLYNRPSDLRYRPLCHKPMVEALEEKWRKCIDLTAKNDFYSQHLKEARERKKVGGKCRSKWNRC